MRGHSAITLELFRHLFSAIAEEMGVTLGRTAFSPNIKERRDYSCAVFDAAGRMIAQAAHIPVHLGAMPASVAAAINSCDMQPGDAVLLNDPFAGGTHLPDLTLVVPIFTPEGPRSLLGFVASRAHHADVGGMSPGSLPLSTEIYQEGLIIPPVRLVRAGELQEDLVAMICRNCRTPDERHGDLHAQLAAGEVGARRLLDLFSRYGAETVQREADALIVYADQITRRAIAAFPRGRFTFQDVLDDDGQGNRDLPIVVSVEAHGDTLLVDFTGTAPECTGSLNAVESITLSAVLYVVRCIVGESAPVNHGIMLPVRLICPSGTLAHARAPRAVAAGNVETSQRIVDVLLGAMAQILPGSIPAASQGTMNNVLIGGRDDRTGRPFAYYETIAGGMGARPHLDGISGVQTHMTNTLNTPIEALEFSYPMRIIEYSIRRGSGGRGAAHGGDGLRRSIELLTPSTLTLMTERRASAPYGLAGGEPGNRGANWLVPAGSTTPQPLPAKTTRMCEAGDVIIVETPGGGGHGPPEGRDAEPRADDGNPRDSG